MLTLGEIVGSALQNQGVKVASLQDAVIEDRSFQRVDDYLARELGQRDEDQPASIKQASAPPEDTDSLDDISFALKIAQALEHGALVVQKLAEGGPAPIQPAPFPSAHVTVPQPQASSAARAAQANRRMEDGHPATDDDIPSNEGPIVPPGGFGGGAKTASREGTLRLLRNKMAQHDALVSLGRIDAAEEVLKEARLLKRAAESLVFTDTPVGSHFPDNAGVRNLTKAQARDANQRQAGAYFGEPVKKDNAVQAHMLRTDGLKLSALRLVKQAAAQKEAGFGNALLAVGKGTIGAARGGLRSLGSGARSVSKSLGHDAGLAAGAAGPVRAPGMLQQGADLVRSGAARGARALGGLSEGTQKAVGGAVLGTAGLGTAGLARSVLGGGDRR